jgi:hypothetical protein
VKLDQKVFGKYVQSTIWPVMRKIEDDKVYQVVIKECNGRSIPQNSISHAWYNEIAETLGDRTPLEAKCESKAWCGIPIMLAEDQDFREQYESLIKGRFTVEEKLKLMRWFPVTSLMEKPQFAQYLEAMREHWGKAGVTLLYPEDLQRFDYPESKRA